MPDNQSDPETGRKPPAGVTTRQAREAAALRENLRKRKLQARLRETSPEREPAQDERPPGD